MIANELVMDDDNLAFLATIRQVLVECTDFNDTRNKYFRCFLYGGIVQEHSWNLSKKLVFTSYDVKLFFHSSYVALILSCF